jgi:arginase
LAVKLIRQPNKIALIGAPWSAGARESGFEKAPAALRGAGLAEKLASAGYSVEDLGDSGVRMFASDDEHPRARNLPEVLAGLNDLRPRVELAVKSGVLPLVLGGECGQAIAIVAGARRYFKHLNVIWMDAHADLNTPAITPSGCVCGMVVAHMTGHGAAELVRFWGEPPLVREPGVMLFGVQRLDPGEQEFLTRSPMPRLFAPDVRGMGGRQAALQALERLHGDARQFILHLDVDVLAAESFGAAAALGSPEGLSLEEARAALRVFLSHKNLLAMDVAQYHPDKDPDGGGARLVVDLLVDALQARLEASAAAEQPKPAAPESSPSEPVEEAAPTQDTPSLPTGS